MNGIKTLNPLPGSLPGSLCRDNRPGPHPDGVGQGQSTPAAWRAVFDQLQALKPRPAAPRSALGGGETLRQTQSRLRSEKTWPQFAALRSKQEPAQAAPTLDLLAFSRRDPNSVHGSLLPEHSPATKEAAAEPSTTAERRTGADGASAEPRSDATVSSPLVGTSVGPSQSAADVAEPTVRSAERSPDHSQPATAEAPDHTMAAWLPARRRAEGEARADAPVETAPDKADNAPTLDLLALGPRDPAMDHSRAEPNPAQPAQSGPLPNVSSWYLPTTNAQAGAAADAASASAPDKSLGDNSEMVSKARQDAAADRATNVELAAIARQTSIIEALTSLMKKSSDSFKSGI